MKRTLIVLVLAVSGLMAAATPAYADVTFFLGFSTTPETRPARGFAGGINFLLFGFEFDYASTSADDAAGAPNLRTGMLNGVVMTPTKTQLYLTAGGGFYREKFPTSSETSFGLASPEAGRGHQRLLRVARVALAERDHHHQAGAMAPDAGHVADAGAFQMLPHGGGGDRQVAVPVQDRPQRRREANRRLARNHGVIASFSRALTEGLTAQQTDAEFDAALDASIQSIYQASVA